MEPEHDEFVSWLRQRAAAAGFDPDSRGGISNLARAAGVDPAPVSRAINGKMIPKVETQRALAIALGIEPREMYVRSGTIRAEDLGGGGPAALSEVDFRQIAAQLGISQERQEVFAEAVMALARGLRGPEQLS